MNSGRGLVSPQFHGRYDEFFKGGETAAAWKILVGLNKINDLLKGHTNTGPWDEEIRIIFKNNNHMDEQ